MHCPGRTPHKPFKYFPPENAGEISSEEVRLHLAGYHNPHAVINLLLSLPDWTPLVIPLDFFASSGSTGARGNLGQHEAVLRWLCQGQPPPYPVHVPAQPQVPYQSQVRVMRHTCHGDRGWFFPPSFCFWGSFPAWGTFVFLCPVLEATFFLFSQIYCAFNMPDERINQLHGLVCAHVGLLQRTML